MALRPNELRIGIIAGLLLCSVWAVYLPVIWFNFTNYDDPDYVLENLAVVSGLTWEGVRWAFTEFHSGNWHPLTWISHMLDCQLYGVAPSGHHITNVVLHSFNTVLLFGFLRFITGALWPSAMAAALFGVHPMHVESVAWISERKDVLSALFGILSLWAYAAYAKLKIAHSSVSATISTQAEEAIKPQSFGSLSSKYYVLSLLFLALGLMSKQMLVTWPFVMLLLDCWPLGRFQFLKHHLPRGPNLARLLFEKLPFFLLSALACVITVLSQKSGTALASFASVPLDSRILNAVISYVQYIGKLIWPAHLSVIYLDQGHPSSTLALLAALVLLSITGAAWWFRARRPYVLVGWLWFIGTLVPVIGLVRVGNQTMADRYTYLPAIGLFIMGIWAVGKHIHIIWSPKRGMIGGAWAGIAVILAYATVAQRQVLVWQNSETLFRQALAVSPDNYLAQNSLAYYYADLGQTELAERIFRNSLKIHPGDAPAWNKLGSLTINKGRYAEAEQHCQTALKIDPRMTEAHTTLGLALIKQGKTNEALASYSEALRFNPRYSPAHYNLGNILAHQGRLDLAVKHYQACLRFDPRSADAHNNLAYILRNQQQFDAATVHFESALRLRANFWQAHYGFGETLLKQNRFEPASAEFARVTQLKPDLAVAHFQLALALAAQGKSKAAVESVDQAYLLAVRSGQQDLARKSHELRERLKARPF